MINRLTFTSTPCAECVTILSERHIYHREAIWFLLKLPTWRQELLRSVKHQSPRKISYLFRDFAATRVLSQKDCEEIILTLQRSQISWHSFRKCIHGAVLCLRAFKPNVGTFTTYVYNFTGIAYMDRCAHYYDCVRIELCSKCSSQIDRNTFLLHFRKNLLINYNYTLQFIVYFAQW